MAFGDGLDALRLRAALASGRPQLGLSAESEEAAGRALELLRSLLGALPQADLIEPFDEDDEGGWEIDVVLPGLAPEEGLIVDRSLTEAGWEPRWSVAQAPGAAWAEVLGWTHREIIEVDGVEARMTSVGDPPEEVQLDLVPGQTSDPALDALEAELVQALREALPELRFLGDRGEDKIIPVIHRPTGRLGVQLWFPGFVVDAHDAQALNHAIVGALARVVRARVGHESLPIAPWVDWSARIGWTFTLWAVARPVQALPGDQPVGTEPREGLLSLIRRDAGGFVEELELHVVPSSPSAHDGLLHEIPAVLGAEEVLVGARPRWLPSPWGAPAFCPVWTLPPDARLPLERLSGHPGVAGWRLVPGQPAGLHDRWPTVDPAFHQGERRVLVRWRDAGSELDRLELTTPREPDAIDAQITTVLRFALADAGSLPVLPPETDPIGTAVSDSSGRPGLDILVTRLHTDEARVRNLFDALGRASHPELAAIASWGYTDDGLTVRLWRRFRPDFPAHFE